MSDKDCWKTRSQRALHCTQHWSLGLCTRHPTLCYSGSLINLGRSTMSYSCTSHYLDLGRHTLIVSTALKAKSLYKETCFNFEVRLSLSPIHDFPIYRSRLSGGPDWHFFWQLPCFDNFRYFIALFLFLLLEKRKDTKFRHVFQVALSSIIRDADAFRMAVNTYHTRNPLN